MARGSKFRFFAPASTNLAKPGISATAKRESVYPEPRCADSAPLMVDRYFKLRRARGAVIEWRAL